MKRPGSIPYHVSLPQLETRRLTLEKYTEPLRYSTCCFKTNHTAATPPLKNKREVCQSGLVFLLVNGTKSVFQVTESKFSLALLNY